MSDKLQKTTGGIIKSNASYIVILSVIAVLLLLANFPAYLLVFFGVFAFFVWKAFSPTHHHEVRGIFEFYLAANEQLRDDDRRWFGFETHEVLHAGEKIVNAMPDAPPLVLFTLGALYHKAGNHEAAIHYLSGVLEKEEFAESARLTASAELKNYVRVLRKIERDPAEAPQTSAAIRALERARRNRAAVLLTDSRNKIAAAAAPAAEHFLAEDSPVLDLTGNTVDAGPSFRWENTGDNKVPVRQIVTEPPPATPAKQDQDKTAAPDDERKSISEVLKDIYDR